MKTQLRHAWITVIGITAFALSACQQQTADSQFQTQAAQLLSSINQNVSEAKFSTTGSQILGGTSFSTGSTAANSWIPYNNYYMQAQPTTELQEAESFLAQLPMTAETFQYRIATLYQAAMDTYQAENALATNQFQTIDPQSQEFMAYNNYWRYPYSYDTGFSNFYSGQGSSFLPNYNSNGYVSQAYPYQ
jgi:hypothetical protein